MTIMSGGSSLCFQAAILNGSGTIEGRCSVGMNARYLASLLDAIDGIHSFNIRRHHPPCGILSFALYKDIFSNAIEQFVKVLQQEGIPASTGYVPCTGFMFSEPEQKFKGLDMLYKGKLCGISTALFVNMSVEEAVWLPQVLLGTSGHGGYSRSVRKSAAIR